MKRYYLFLIFILTLTFCRTRILAETLEKDRKMGDSYYETNNNYQISLFSVTSNPAAPSNTIAKGVDLSHHNGDVNFETLKKNVDFVILRCGYGMDLTDQDDRKFETYVKACKTYNLPFGVYLYSYADTLDKAKSEAAHTIRLLNKCKEWNADLSLPVFYDMEDSGQAALSASMKAQIASAYCSILNANGYITGIYANTDWWTNYLTNSYFNTVPYHWVARYGSSLNYSGKCDMWQCSESAVLPNMSGTSDLNYMFTNMLSIQHPAQTSSTDMGSKINLQNCTISTIPNQTYKGSQIRPSISVTYEGMTLNSGTDYKLSYGTNIKPGTGYITITAAGTKYTGTIKRTFIILPAKTAITTGKYSSKKYTISWKKLPYVSGYDVTFRLKGTNTWRHYYPKTNKKVIKGLRKNRIYQWKVKAYILINGKKYYGAYSKTVNKRIK